MFASNSVDHMLDEYIKSSTDCLKQLRNIIQPIRLDIFSMKNSFSGTLNENDQVETVSPHLLNLTSMLIDGQVNLEGKCSQPALTVAQIITFNIRRLEKSKQPCSTCHAHKKERETPSVIYISLKIYATVRSRSIIDHLLQLGMCVI